MVSRALRREANCLSEHVRAGPKVIEPGDRHFANCPHGVRLSGTCHDPVVQVLAPIFDAAIGASNVYAERGGPGGGRLSMTS